MTGDFLWQFRSEFGYYERYKPDWYLAGKIDYRQPDVGISNWSLLANGVWPIPNIHFNHSVLFWLFVPAAIWFIRRKGNAVIAFMIVSSVVIFAFFEFYPQYLDAPLSPAAPPGSLSRDAVAWLDRRRGHDVPCAFPESSRSWRRWRCVSCSVTVVNEAARRSHEYNDSQQRHARTGTVCGSDRRCHAQTARRGCACSKCLGSST